MGRNMTDPDTPDARRKRAERLEIARRVYRALVAQAPDRVITLRDGEGRWWLATICSRSAMIK